MEASNSVEVAFDGTKFYWRTRNTVDVVIAHHKACQTFEVIVYEPSLDMEAPRLYISEDIMMPKVGNDEIESKLSFAKRNNVPLTEKFVSGIVNKAVSDFILNRLVITELVASAKKFSVELKVTDSEIKIQPDFTDLVCARPEGLVPHQSRHYKHLMEGAVVAAMQALAEDTRTLQDSCELAVQMSARVSPAVRDRWRMPIVIGKVLRGASLGITDGKIFEKIKSNLYSDGAVARMHAVMRKVPTSPLSRRSSAEKEQSSHRRGSAAHARSPIARERSRQGALEKEKEVSITRRCGADAHSATATEIAALKRNISASRFDTVSSRGKVAAEDLQAQPSTVSSKKTAAKNRKFKVSSKASQRSPKDSFKGTQEDSMESASQLSDSGDQQDLVSTTPFERVLAGFTSLRASLRSSFQFGMAGNIDAIAEGRERTDSRDVLLSTAPVVESVMGASAPVDPVAAVTDFQATIASAAADEDCSGRSSRRPLDPELDTSPSAGKPRVTPRSYLGSFLLALTGRHSGEAVAAAPPSRHGSAASMGAALTAWMTTSSNKVVPAQ